MTIKSLIKFQIHINNFFTKNETLIMKTLVILAILLLFIIDERSDVVTYFEAHSISQGVLLFTWVVVFTITFLYLLLRKFDVIENEEKTKKKNYFHE